MIGHGPADDKTLLGMVKETVDCRHDGGGKGTSNNTVVGVGDGDGASVFD